MKKTIIASAIVLALSIVATGGAEEKMQRILLRDKSVIIGQVIEMKEGVYTIKTDAMGEFKISAEKILEISALELDKQSPAPQSVDNTIVEEPVSAPSPRIAIRDGAKERKTRTVEPSSDKPAASDDLSRQQEEVNSRVRSMTMNGEFLDSMMDLSQNSGMMDIMSDPEIMDAISRNDYDYLMNSEKMKNLMDSEDIKNLLGDVQP